MRTISIFFLAIVLFSCDQTLGRRTHPDRFYLIEAQLVTSDSNRTIELTCDQVKWRGGVAYQEKEIVQATVAFLAPGASVSVLIYNSQKEMVAQVTETTVVDQYRLRFSIPASVSTTIPLSFRTGDGEESIDYYPGYYYLYPSEAQTFL